MQEIIVYIILAIVAVVLIRYIYRQVTGKNRGCNCGSCPMNGGECHCHEKCGSCPMNGGECHCHEK